MNKIVSKHEINYLYTKIVLMFKLYECFDLIFLFYSNEHDPIHVHGKYQDKESKAEIVFENGKYKEILIKDVAGKEPLDNQNLKIVKRLLSSAGMI